MGEVQFLVLSHDGGGGPGQLYPWIGTSWGWSEAVLTSREPNNHRADLYSQGRSDKLGRGCFLCSKLAVTWAALMPVHEQSFLCAAEDHSQCNISISLSFSLQPAFPQGVAPNTGSNLPCSHGLRAFPLPFLPPIVLIFADQSLHWAGFVLIKGTTIFLIIYFIFIPCSSIVMEEILFVKSSA